MCLEDDHEGAKATEGRDESLSLHEHVQASKRGMSAPRPIGWLTVPGPRHLKPQTFEVHSHLGCGSYGTVVKGLRSEDKKWVAIKMISTRSSMKLVDAEVATLRDLERLTRGKDNFVKLLQDFIDKDGRQRCLVFELLDKSLLDLMKERQFQPLPLRDNRTVVKQLAIAQCYLKEKGYIHADIKPANIMLVDHQREPFKVKLIDFGLAIDVSAAKVGKCVQTLPYRSPEICLGLPFTEAIDMWSLGCVAAFLYLGQDLYPGEDPYDVIKGMVETQGQLPDHVLTQGEYTRNFFSSEDDKTHWKLKTPECPPLKKPFSSLNERCSVIKTGEENHVVKEFVDMLKEMLRLDATTRISPLMLLKHKFILRFASSGGPRMGARQNEKQLFANNIQANPACVETSSQFRPPPSGNKPNPSTDNQERIDRSGRKREADDEGKAQTSFGNFHKLTGPRIRISHFAKKSMADDAVVEQTKTKLDFPDQSNDRSGNKMKDIRRNRKQGGDGGTALDRVAKATQKNPVHEEPCSQFQPNSRRPCPSTRTSMDGCKHNTARPAATTNAVKRKLSGTYDKRYENTCTSKQTCVNTSISSSTGQTRREGIVYGTDSKFGYKSDVGRSTRIPQPHCSSGVCPEGSTGAEKLPLLGSKRKCSDHIGKLRVKRLCEDTSTSTFNSTLPPSVSISGSTGQTREKGSVYGTNSNIGYKSDAGRSTRIPKPHCPSGAHPEGSTGAEGLPLLGSKRECGDQVGRLPVERTREDTSTSAFNGTLPPSVSAGQLPLSSCKKIVAPGCRNKKAKKNIPISLREKWAKKTITDIKNKNTLWKQGARTL